MSTHVLPPPLREATAEDFRAKIAGLADPHDEALTPESRADIVTRAVTFGAILYRHYDRDKFGAVGIKRRVMDGVEVACRKSGDDIRLLVSLALEHIGADAGRLFNDRQYLGFAAAVDDLMPEERTAFRSYLLTRRFLYLARAWQEWETEKAEKAERRAEAKKTGKPKKEKTAT